MPRLYKKEKLCSVLAIDALFGRNADSHGALCFPLRAVWRPNPGRRSDSPVQFMISVPKKRLRHAVDRVTMRRRIREAYRLLRDSHPLPPGRRVDVAFIYVDSGLQPYSKVASAMERVLSKIADED